MSRGQGFNRHDCLFHLARSRRWLWLEIASTPVTLECPIVDCVQCGVLRESLDDDESKQRVLNWAAARLGVALSGRSIRGGGSTGSGVVRSSGKEDTVDLSFFESVADAFGRAHCKNEPEKVLVVASYLQEHDGKSELTGREINKELTHLGHGVSNITVAIGSLINRKPKLMIQTRKEGKTQQAQKKYKVTGEGVTAARKLLSPVDEE